MGPRNLLVAAAVVNDALRLTAPAGVTSLFIALRAGVVWLWLLPA